MGIPGRSSGGPSRREVSEAMQEIIDHCEGAEESIANGRPGLALDDVSDIKNIAEDWT